MVSLPAVKVGSESVVAAGSAVEAQPDNNSVAAVARAISPVLKVRFADMFDSLVRSPWFIISEIRGETFICYALFRNVLSLNRPSVKELL
jgi:hypothetical protein